MRRRYDSRRGGCGQPAGYLLTDDFEGAVRAILACTGKVVVTGMGKSGLIGKKIAATLASTGTPPFFCIRAKPITAIWV